MADLPRSTNPVLKESAFAGAIPTGETMTIQGTVNKTGLLLLFVVATAAWTWGLSHSPTPEAVYPWMLGGAIGGFVVALVTIFKKEWSPTQVPLSNYFVAGLEKTRTVPDDGRQSFSRPRSTPGADEREGHRTKGLKSWTRRTFI